MDMNEQLKVLAKQERRSVSRTVEILLEEALKTHGLPPESIRAETDTAA